LKRREDEEAVTPVEERRLASALLALRVDPPAPLSPRIVARWVEVDGPVEPLLVASTDRGFAYVRPLGSVEGRPDGFADEFRERFGRPVLKAAKPSASLVAALATGRGRDLPFDLRNLTEFEQAVLRKALEIPHGEIRPYAWIAAEVGRPGAVRAAGSALARNPVPVLIPCHRVVRGNGEIGDYIFGSAVKAQLLRAEGVSLDEVHAFAEAGIRYLGSDTTHIVCYPTCHAARRITLAHRIGFRTLGQAVGAGYRACRLCRPTSTSRALRSSG
jgi:methylated-DNA-[protein]-cysteine S-methyltransferase